MAYTQSPVNVIKGQMTNKAAGLAHGDSMALQNDNKKKNVKSGQNINEILKNYPLHSQERYEKYRELGLTQDETTKPPQDERSSLPEHPGSRRAVCRRHDSYRMRCGHVRRNLR